jgi:hypothetical protein
MQHLGSGNAGHRIACSAAQSSDNILVECQDQVTYNKVSNLALWQYNRSSDPPNILRVTFGGKTNFLQAQ